MITTLDELIAPLSGAEFRKLLTDREVRVLRGVGVGRFEKLVDWDRLVELAASGAYPASLLRMTRGTEALPPLLYREGNAPRAEAIRRVMSTQGSMLMNGLEPYVPELETLAGAIAAELGEKVVAATVSSMGPGGAVKRHYDKSDVVALQIDGRKRWLIGRDAVLNPVPGMRDDPPGDDSDLLMDLVLEPGDLLIVPAGYPHRCENLGERSLHLTFFIYPVTAPRMLDLLFRAMVTQPETRRAFRFAADDAAAQAELREMIVQRVREMPFDELLAQHRATHHAPGRQSE